MKSIKSIVEDVIQEENANAIPVYTFDGITLTQNELPVIMRNTLLLTMFHPQSFLILRAHKHADLEYDQFQTSLELQLARGIKHRGKRFHVLGASSSLKNGVIWLARKGVVDTIHSSFSSAQEALSYLGIYTSNNHHGIFKMEYPIKVVENGYKLHDKLITGDGEGYIPMTIMKKLGQPDRQIQVRLIGENWIAKGTLHPHEGEDFIIPKSMVKGKGTPQSGFQYFLLGIREVARELLFSSSWTLLQFFSKETIQSTIPALKKELNRLEGVLTDRNKALTFMGTAENEEDRFKLESLLKVGLRPTHPYLTNRIKKHLKKHYRSLALGSAVSLKGYMASVADIDDGVVCCQDRKPGALMLTRYPIRDYRSLVRVVNDPNLIKDAKSGSLYVSNNTIVQIDGDYDGDLLVLCDERSIVSEVSSLEFGNGYVRLDGGEKIRKKDPLKLLPFVASEAVSIGNKVGYITFLINSAILNGRKDLLPILSMNLQLEVQSLKWSTNHDRDAINAIAEKLEIVTTFRECKFNKKAFVSFVPEVDERYRSHPMFIPYFEVQKRFKSLGDGDELLSFRYELPIYDYDIVKHQSEASSVVNLYNSWVADILESCTENDDPGEALQAPISFLKAWSGSKSEDRKDWTCTIWSLVHRRSNGKKSIGSAAFQSFEDEVLELLGKKSPTRVSISSNKFEGQLKTLTAVGGYFDMDGNDPWQKLRVFRSKVRELGRRVTIDVKQNKVDPDGKDFYAEDLRLGSLPRDQFSIYDNIQVGERFEAVITQHGKVTYIHRF